MKRLPSYDKVLQDFEKQYLLLLNEYLSKMHETFHVDKGLEASHIELVNTIRQDCMLMCSSNLEKLTFDDRAEEQVIKEILEYNFEIEDVKYMKEVEKLDLYPFLNLLEENCIKRTEPLWFQFGINEMMANGRTYPGTIGSKRTQFCRYCGEVIYVSMNDNSHASKHRGKTKLD